MKSLCALLILLSLPVDAGLIVAGDLGGEPAAPWYEPISPEPEVLATPAPLQPVDESYGLPVISDKLSPGNVTRRDLNLPGMPPLFLVGDDPQSLQWLDEKHQQLLALNASGFAVNVSSLNKLNALRARVPGAVLIPVPGDDLATRLQISHYPVLITAKQLSQ